MPHEDWDFLEEEDDESFHYLFEEDSEEFEEAVAPRRVFRKKKLNEKTFITRKGGLEGFARAIQEFEGWFPPGRSEPRGSTSFRNNNPGNLKYVGQSGAVGVDERGFAIFSTPRAGWQALLRDIGAKRLRHPNWTVEDFFEVYAPRRDGNDPEAYARFVARSVGATSSTRLNELF